jgi:hypothetical protein
MLKLFEVGSTVTKSPIFIFELLHDTEYNQYVSEHAGVNVAAGNWQLTLVS